jgi:type I restriction enzyme, S subunit
VELNPGYKKTELGLVPADWTVGKLKDYCTRLTVGFVGTCEPFYARDTDGVVLLRTGNLQGGRLDLADVKYVTKTFHAANRKSHVNHGDILVARHGDLGNAVLVPTSIDNVNALNIVIIRTDERHLLGRFAVYSINSDAVKMQALRQAAGSTQVVINTGEIANLLIGLPSVREQRAITEALGDTDALVESLEDLLAKKRHLKQGALQALLTGNSRLPGFRGRWEVKSLGELADMASGGTPPSGNPAFYDGDIPWVSISDMTKCGKFISTTERNLSRSGLQYSAARMWPAGTVLYAMYASLGECSIAATPVCSSQAVLGIRVRSGLHSEFLYYFLISIKARVKTVGQQGTQPNLNKGMVQSFQLHLPSLPEQVAIASVLSEMDDEITALEEKLAKARAIKQGMMQVLLTGQIRVV